MLTPSTPQRLASVQAQLQEHLRDYSKRTPLPCGCGRIVRDSAGYGHELTCRQYLRLHERASRIEDSLEPVRSPEDY